MKSERLGLLMIVASLLVIATIVGILFERQASAAHERIRVQGVGLARALSSVSHEQLVARSGQTSVLKALLNLQGNPDLGYGVFVDGKGNTLLEITSPGTIVPGAPLPAADPSSWFGERTLASPGDGRRIREFFAPVLDRGNHSGFIRLGYFEPRLGVGLAQVSFIALVALPIFLLAPLFYFLLKREMKPLSTIAERLRTLSQSSAAGAELAPNAELRDFIGRFDQFVRLSESKLQAMESERISTITSNRLLSYKTSKLEAVLQALPDAVLLMDESGLVSYASAKALSLLGVEQQEILRQPLQAWCRDAQVLGFLSRRQNGESPAFHAETLEYTPEGAPDKKMAATVTPVLSTADASGFQGTLVMLRDVTQEHLSRQAGTEFVSHVSHELKTPLNTLRMYAELLLGDDGQSDDLRIEATNTIVDEVERMAALINNLLNISKLESGTVALERGRTKLGDLLSDAFDNLAQAGRDKDLTFDLRIPPHLPAVLLDKDLFRIAVNNLLSNAIKYNRHHGTVTLEAEETDDEILVHVADTGIGIPAADQQTIFEKFSRGSDEEAISRPGHGLGLYLSRQIVELHHGTLSVQSEPGVGTRFSIHLQKSPMLVREALAV